MEYFWFIFKKELVCTFIMVLFSFGLSDIEIQAQNTKCMYIVRKK